MRFAFFPAFFDRPEHINFIEQEESEHIILLLRRHWVTNVPWILTSIFAILLPFAFFYLEEMFNLQISPNIPANIFVAAIVSWYILTVAYIIENFLNWYFNIYIVTNLHIVDINFFSLLYREIVEIRIQDVESAASKVQGIIASLFYFGDVMVETAAEKQNINFESVPNPDLVADRIQDLQGQLDGGTNGP